MAVSEGELVQSIISLLGMTGKDGGMVSPSIYDTAQMLQLHPPEQVQPLIDWLLSQQRDDGGWFDPVTPYVRDTPTLAAILALSMHSYDHHCMKAVERGLSFLVSHDSVWEGSYLPEDIPVAAELVLPALLDRAFAHVHIPERSYKTLRMLGLARLALIRRFQPAAGTAPSHAWETWGRAADPAIIDGSGGVGNSPAATAFWLSLSKQEGLEQQRQQAERFLHEAAMATPLKTPGLVPTVWPIKRFEQAWVLYALLVSKLISHPLLVGAARAQLDDLYQALGPNGIGMSDHFIHDGDTTSTAVGVLAGCGYELSPELVRRYQLDDQFFTYKHELQASLTTTAHALFALGQLGEQATSVIQYLLSKQNEEGLWVGDKWHMSWLYPTSQVAIALAYAGQASSLGGVTKAVLAKQHADGGWGILESTAEETAYALQTVCSSTARHAPLTPAVERGLRFLEASRGQAHPALWLGKEPYVPVRVVESTILSAMYMAVRWLRSGQTISVPRMCRHAGL